MARTLPWLKSGTTTNLQPARLKPAKRQRMLDPNSDSDSADNVNPRAVTTPKKQAAPAAERTPSTSPPPQPPTEEFMRPGLSADDIYIMVEDEFHAVAQTFTKHLHHAEYIRLRNAVRDRNAPTINNISRPVDSITTMREETRRKKEAEAREAKMKAAIESIKVPKGAIGPLDESDISDFEEDRQDDPWQGTQLQHFITTSPKKNLTGLTGLQGVISHTRAAAGYSKPEKRPSQPTKLFEPARPNASASKTIFAPAAGNATSDTDDDDLDAPSRLPPRPPTRIPSRPPTTAAKPTPLPTSRDPPHRQPKRRAPTPPPAKPFQRSFLDLTPRAPPASIPLSSKASRRPIPPDPSPPVRPEPLQEPRSSLSDVRQRLKVRREREERERKRSGSGIGVDDIPVFLV
ncbi:hypothetical protein HO133_007409 [Letharia lupina]|uniref:Uncharacterized protein n=1 Tax=Letharia lupina TaxID=560253 RepID=A0A8H6FIU5_9LECA|nr:uncharacterized protein HO133_007409 [Letharia lupina]KAF6229293.1 hypothetical protein HO133_007409 [Letharia lupina]